MTALALILALGLGVQHSGHAVRAAPASSSPDRDGDGVADRDDRCVDRPGLSGDGCPPRDSDGDGILDRADRCPDQPGPRGNSGCPDRDTDADGVVDRMDRCVDAFGHPDAGGCPVPDRDGDGVADADDRCPDRAEVWNDRRDADGCPDRGRPLVTVTGGVITLAGKRLFRSSGALTSRGRRVMRVALAVLTAARARQVQVIVAAEHGAAHGDGVARARRQADSVAARLTEHRPSLKVTPDPRGPDSAPRVQLAFR